MKTIPFLFIGLFFLAMNSAAQNWTAQAAPSTSNILYGVRFADTSNGWAVGANGTIFKTSNGGTAWTTQNSANAGTMYAAYFINKDTGWTGVGAGTNNGTLRKTVNGGTTWTSQTTQTGTVRGIYCMSFPNASIGWFVGQNGVIFKTVNGGDNWTAQTSGTASLLHAVQFLDTSSGWAVGAGGVVCKTTNGGATWTLYLGERPDMIGVHFINRDTGWIVGASGYILKTVNGGVLWSLQAGGVTTQQLNWVHFTSPTDGWAAGNGGIILRTVNAGMTWTIETTGTTMALHSIHFGNANVGWAVGDAGTILKIRLSTTPIFPYRRAASLSVPEGFENLTDVRGRLIWKKQNAPPARGFSANREVISSLPQQ